MKKTQKKVLGFLGLALVTAVTIFAAFLPGPEASAMNSVTDVINIRVISRTPSAEITKPASGSIFVSPKQTIRVLYDYAKSLVVEIKNTDRDGIIQTKVLWDGDLADEIGELNFDFAEISKDLGFGEYTVTVNGMGVDGIQLPGDSVNFSYYPVIGSTESNFSTGKVFLDLDYLPYEPNGLGRVNTIKVNIYDKDGNLVSQLSNMIVNAPDARVELPFDRYGLPWGEYSVEIIAFGINGDELYLPYYTTAVYKFIIPETPNTGTMFESLNISRTDYLITGALMFSIIGVSSIVFVIRRSTSSKRRK